MQPLWFESSPTVFIYAVNFSGGLSCQCGAQYLNGEFIYLVHKENPTRCNNISKFYYSIFIWTSTCFGQHTAHHQEPKTALAASDFSYMEGCWTCGWWTLSGTLCLTTSTDYTSNNLPRMKNRGCQCSFRLLMMGGVSPETCWASYKYGIIKFWYIVLSCWIFLYESCVNTL